MTYEPNRCSICRKVTIHPFDHPACRAFARDQGPIRAFPGGLTAVVVETRARARRVKADDAARARKARDHRDGRHTFPSLEAGGCYRCAQVMQDQRR